MKQIEKVIKLVRELHRLGYKQETKKGDWLIAKYDWQVILWETMSHAEYDTKDFIPIPSLEDGLKWLRENSSDVSIIANPLGLEDKNTEIHVIAKWGCLHGESIITDWVYADTPHEAVLMAMVKILEVKL